MRTPFLALIGLLALSLFTGSVQAGKPFEDPAPIAVGAGLSIEGVRKSIKVALVGRNWNIIEDNGNKITATYAKGNSWSATITIAYGMREIVIKYADSANLDFEQNEDGTREIHKNYPGWINNLVTDINKNMILASPTG